MIASNKTSRKHLYFFNWLAATIILGLLPATNFAQTVGAPATPATNSPARGARQGNVPANPSLPSLYLIGDSTVRNGTGNGAGGQWGWGDKIAPLFDTEKINVVNRAAGGTSSRTYYRDQWPRVLAMVKPGDFVIMQFGHNDAGALNDEPPGPLRARGTIPGIGDETKEIDNVMTKQHEVVHTFGWYEKQIVAEVRAKGATPMIASLIPRNKWKDGKAARDAADYGGWAGQSAKAVNAPFIDINEIIARRYDTLGQEKVNALFVVGAGPHTSLEGAEVNAECVVAGLKGLEKNPLTAFLSEKGKAVPPADLSQPAAK